MGIIDVVGIISNSIGLIVAILGFAYGAYQKRKNRSIQWTHLDRAIKSIILPMKQNFVPDILYAPTQKSGAVVELILPYLQSYTPTIFGLGISKRDYDFDEAQSRILNAGAYYHFETTKWHAYIPKSIRAYRERKILIVDDFAMSGEYLKALKEFLIHKVGFDPKKIKTLCLATTEVAVNNGLAPDYCWRTTDNATIYLPWGKPK